MRMMSRVASTVAMVGALATPGIVAGCAHHYHEDGGGVVVAWSDNEEPYYERWEHDTHRDHVEWARRNSDEQKEYWGWRHDHHD
jgi:hypothetical protein